ncbi:MAG: aldose 1-epimerase family protein [Thermotogae bacterium]|nr:aldose 1-epimerase family protein [Thermotogota bacterium]
MKLFGIEFSKKDILERVGDISQLCSATLYSIEDGKGRGLRVVEVRNSNLNFSVLVDRGLDIFTIDYKGVPISYVSKTHITSPAYYESQEYEWLRTFYGGALLTCGLTHVGVPEGKRGLHGRISNSHCEDLSIKKYWKSDKYVVEISGVVREAVVFGEHLKMFRKISTELGANWINIETEIENCSFEKTPLMILYHMNFGFPLLSANTEFLAPFSESKPRDEEAERDGMKFTRFENPIPNYKERVFFHKLKAIGGSKTFAALFNKNFNNKSLGVVMEWDLDQMPYLTEWKMMGQSDYVIGIEPGNCYPVGREGAEKRGELQYIEPLEKKKFDIKLSVFDDVSKYNELIKLIKGGSN